MSAPSARAMMGRSLTITSPANGTSYVAGTIVEFVMTADTETGDTIQCFLCLLTTAGPGAPVQKQAVLVPPPLFPLTETYKVSFDLPVPASSYLMQASLQDSAHVQWDTDIVRVKTN